PGVLPASPLLPALPDVHTSRDDCGAWVQLLRTRAVSLEHTAESSRAGDTVLPHSFASRRQAIYLPDVRADQAPRPARDRCLRRRPRQFPERNYPERARLARATCSGEGEEARGRKE